MTDGTATKESRALAVRTRGLRVNLGGSDILTGVDADFVHLGINALIGPNGAGKTTLLRAILGLAPSRGTLEFHPGRRGGPPRLGFVPQRVDFDRGAPTTVLDLMCAESRLPLFLGRRRDAVARAHEVLSRVGADRLARSYLGRLSGGEFQRVMVAMALLGEPDVLLLDEPVAGVDVAGEALFCDLLVKLRDEAGLSIILVSHEMSIVVQHTDHVVCINDGVVQCQGNPLVTLTAENIARVFGYHAAIYDHGHVHDAECRHGHHHHPHMGHEHPAESGGPHT